MQDLKIKLLETHLIWESRLENRKHFQYIIEAEKEQVDVYVLPEMFTTGFTMNAQTLAESKEGETLRWMQEVSKNVNAAITGSFIVEDQGYRNRMYFVFPDGSYEYYDKRHLFSYAGEDKIYTAGNRKTIVNYKGWKILLQICYDLRFPVFSRNTLMKKGVPSYDLIIYVANWPNSRINIWDTLLKSRAIENLSFVAGVNRIGEDNNGVQYNGHSVCLSPVGEALKESKEVVLITSSELEKWRDKYKFLYDQDAFTLDKII